jgi:hypothetical protein
VRKPLFLLCLAACGATPSQNDAGQDVQQVQDAGTDALDRNGAAQTTAQTSALCTKIAPFYWEIGDVNGAIASGTTGSGLVTSSTQLNIASASKLWWGAYVVERFKSNLAQVDMPSMTMMAGRTNFTSCTGATTVDGCCALAGTDGGTNCDVETNDVSHFFYSGGHFQGYASTLGLGPDDDTALVTELSGKLGAELHFTYTQPQLAGGMKMSASDYAMFLRKILSNGLAIHDHLGENAVCTLPGTSCPTAHYSPAPLAWHYSYGHWVEDEPQTGDGAFSSPGKFGFYPWIDSTKTYYGIVAREDLLPGDGTIQGAPYYQSVLCGRAIRTAFMTGVPQP